MREVRVFLASPGDVAPERRLFFEHLPAMQDLAGVRFVPLGYEIVHSNVGTRPQDAINELVDSCDILLLVFHRHWGQVAGDSIVATSYTEEEFNRALSRFSRTGAPRMLCLFKNIDILAIADPGPQLSRVLAFRKRLEESKKVMYRTFSTEEDLRSELDRHLYTIVRGGSESSVPSEAVLLPVPEDAGPDNAWQRDLALARQGIAAAAGGRVEEATMIFARLSQTTITVPVLDVAQGFFQAIGHQPAVEAIVDCKLALIRDRRLAAREYSAALMRHGWIEELIDAQLAGTPPEDRELPERLLRRIFDDTFIEEMVALMAEHFTLGELRALTRFYSGEAASVAGKMGTFIGGALPPVIEKLTKAALADLGLDEDAS